MRSSFLFSGNNKLRLPFNLLSEFEFETMEICELHGNEQMEREKKGAHNTHICVFGYYD